jgi:hypothetical protein
LPEARSSSASPLQAITAKAASERSLGATRDGLVSLAEVLAPFRVPDDRPVEAELAQHWCGVLTGEGALVLPVDVLCRDRNLGSGEQFDRDHERHERRTDDDARLTEIRTA